MTTADLHKLFSTCSGFSTDTRKIASGNMFFALKGDHFNGNLFATQAIDQGAAYAIVDEEQYIKNDRCILVDNVLKTLQDLALFHRKRLSIPVLAITGTNGKTTTKELTREVLNTSLRVHATVGNLNNHIGVPITLLSMPADTQVAIIEMGANKVGDIAELCMLAEPTHGIITNIGLAHTQGFGSLEGVLRGKSELYDFLIKNEGIIFLNTSNELLNNMAKRIKAPILYPNKGDNYSCELISADPYVIFRDAEGILVETQLIGGYNFENIAIACCIANHFDVEPNKVRQALQSYSPGNNRSQVLKKGSNTIILDAYNANPSSMKLALDNFIKMKHPKKVLILGDMFELGDFSQAEHAKVGQQISKSTFEEVFLCGKSMKLAAGVDNKAIYFETTDNLFEYLKDHSFENTMFFLKASRGMGLEKLVEVL